MIRVGLVLVHRSLPMLLPDGWIILDVTNLQLTFVLAVCSIGSPLDVFSRKRDGTSPRFGVWMGLPSRSPDPDGERGKAKRSLSSG